MALWHVVVGGSKALVVGGIALLLGFTMSSRYKGGGLEASTLDVERPERADLPCRASPSEFSNTDNVALLQEGRKAVLEEDLKKGMMRLAKQLPAVEVPKTPLKVPRIIWQSWKSDGRDDPDSLWVPAARAKAMLTWIEKNPTWEYRLLDDEDLESYVQKIQETYNPKLIEKLRIIKQGASKVDFWRYLVMHHDGGAYFDTDSACKIPLDEWVEPTTTYITGIGGRGDFHQWGLVAAQGNCIFKNAIDEVIERVDTHSNRTTFHRMKILGHDRSSGSIHAKIMLEDMQSFGGPEGLAGPPVLMKAAEKCLMDTKTRDQVLDGFRLCTSDFFGGRALFKAEGLRASTWNNGPVFNHNAASSEAHVLLQDGQHTLDPCSSLSLE